VNHSASPLRVDPLEDVPDLEGLVLEPGNDLTSDMIAEMLKEFDESHLFGSLFPRPA